MFRSRTAWIQNISAPVGRAFKFREPIHDLNDKSEDPKTSDIAIIQPTPGATMNEAFSSSNGDDGRGPDEDTSDDHFLSDARTFSSSPRAASIALSPTSQVSPTRVHFPRSESLFHHHRLTTVRGGFDISHTHTREC